MFANTTTPPSPINYNPTNKINLTINATDTLNSVNTVKLNFNGTTYTPTQTNQYYNVTLGPLAAGTYQYNWTSNDSLGNTNTTPQYTYTILQATPTINITIQPSTSLTYGTTATINCTQTTGDNGATLSLYLNGTLVTSGASPQTTTIMPAGGTYNYTCTYTTSQNYTSTSQEAILTVNKASSTLNLSLNGTQGDIALPKGTIINISSFLSVGQGTISLYKQGVLINTGLTPISNLSNFTTVGVINITAEYAGNENYTNSFITYFVTVQDIGAPTVTAIFPPDIYNTNKSNINFTWTSIDDTDPSTLCNLTINGITNASSINTSSTLPGNKSVTLSDGVYTWEAICVDSVGNNGMSLTNTLTIDTTPPAISNITTQPSSPTTYNNSQTYQFNATITDTLNAVSTTTLKINNTIYSTTANGNTYTAIIPTLAAGTYYYNWTANDSIGNTNTSTTLTYTVNRATSTINLTTIPQNSTYNTTINITCTQQTGDSGTLISLYRNGTLAISSASPISVLENLATGTYNYTCTYPQTQNYTTNSQESTITVGSASPIINITITPSSTTTYGTAVTVNCTELIGDVGATLTLFRNGTSVATGTSPQALSTTPAAGSYNYTCVYNASQNYSTTSQEAIVTVNRATSSINLSTVPQNTGYNTSINITCTQQTGDNGTLISLFRNGTLAMSSASPISVIETLAAGTYNYTCVYPQSQNYTSTSQESIVTINTATPAINITITPSSTITYGTTATINCTQTLGDVGATLSILRNGTLVTSSTSPISILQTPAAGSFNYTCTYPQTQNYTSTSEESIVTVNKAASALNLTLNGTAANININSITTINLTAILLQGQGSINLYRDGILINTGTSPISNLSFFSTPGVYNITARYTATENYSTSSLTYFVTFSDIAAPNVTLIYPAPSTNASQNIINFTWSALDDINTSFICTLFVDATLIQSSIPTLNNTPTNYSYGPLADGPHLWEVSCTDGVNTAYSGTNSFTVDTTAPNITNITTQPTLPLTNNGSQQNISVNFTSSEYPIIIVFYILNGTNGTVSTQGPITINSSNDLPWPFIIPALPDGNYTIWLNSTDIANNTNKTFLGNLSVFSGDVTPPIISSVTTIGITNQTANATWNTDELANSSINFGTNTSLGFTIVTATLTTNHNLIIPGLANNTIHYYNVTSCDSNGNCASSGIYNFTTLQNNDTLAPVITNINATTTNQTGTITFNTDEPSNTTITYGTTPGLGSNISNGTLTQNHNTTIPGLQNNTLYYYNITTCDGSGNCITTGVFNFTTLQNNGTVPDLTPPTIQLIFPTDLLTLNITAINFSWIAIDNEASSMQCNLTVNGSTTGPFTSANNTPTNKTMTLPTNGTYLWNVSCADTLNNVNTSATKQFTINQTPAADTTPPQVSKISPISGNEDTPIGFSATVTDNIGVTSCVLLIDGSQNGSMTVSGSTANKTFSFGQPGIYTLAANCTDLAGNSHKNDTTVAILDITSPIVTILSPLTTIYNYTNVSVSLNASDNVAVGSYWFSYNDSLGNQSANISWSSIIDVQFPDNATITLFAYANDTSGNTGSSSVTFTINVSAPPDITAPSISNINVSAITNQSAIVNWNTDESGNSTITYGTTTALGSTTSNAAFQTAHNISLASLINNTLYYFNVTSCDLALNCNTTGPFNFTTLQNIQDITPPSLVLDTPADNATITSSSTTLSWTATDDIATSLQCNVTLNGSVIQTNVASTSGSPTTASATSLTNGVYYWNVSCADPSGNSNTSATRMFTVSITITPPSGGGGHPIPTPTYCVVNWNCVNVGGCIHGLQERDCVDYDGCNDVLGKPSTVILCNETAPVLPPQPEEKPPVEQPTAQSPPVEIPAPVIPAIQTTTIVVDEERNVTYQLLESAFMSILLSLLLFGLLGALLAAGLMLRRKEPEEDFFGTELLHDATRYIPYELVVEAYDVLEAMHDGAEKNELKRHTPFVVHVCGHALDEAKANLETGKMPTMLNLEGHIDWITARAYSRVVRRMAAAMLAGIPIVISADGHKKVVEVKEDETIVDDYPRSKKRIRHRNPR
jgi:hypothetical protein